MEPSLTLHDVGRCLALKQCPRISKFEQIKLKQWAAASPSLGYAVRRRGFHRATASAGMMDLSDCSGESRSMKRELHA
jgi:hypothetical protein